MNTENKYMHLLKYSTCTCTPGYYIHILLNAHVINYASKKLFFLSRFRGWIDSRDLKELTCSGCISALSMAEAMAMAPSFVAGSDAKLPRKLPIGVRAELTINTSFGRLTLPKLLARGGCLSDARDALGDLRANALHKLAIFLQCCTIKVNGSIRSVDFCEFNSSIRRWFCKINYSEYLTVSIRK